MLRDRPGSQPSEYSFWDHPGAWPHDPPGYVLLARACQEVGRAMFGAQWAESWGEPDEPPDDCGLATWEHYKHACDEFQNAFVAMRAEVVQSIGGQCEIGTLVAAVRPKAGGQMIALEQHMWNAEGVEPRFHRCDMSLDDPFETGGGSCRFYWIFLERASLDTVLGQVPQRSPLQNIGASIPDGSVPRIHAFDMPRDHKFRLAMMAFVAIYGPNGPELGETEEECFHKVNEWLLQNGKHAVSKPTLRRGKRALRTQYQAERN
jgi:hypothetical protein